MSLGGRASEDMVFGKISTGAQNDLQQITRMAYAMVTVYGMNTKVGNVSFYDPAAENTFTKPYSEETSRLIDEEVRKLIDSAYQRTKQLLKEKQEQVKKLAEALLNREVLFQSDVEALIGKRPYEEKKTLDVTEEDGTNHTDHGIISEGVPPYDSNATNHSLSLEESQNEKI
jgi:cell division protease FtsH